MLYGLIFEKLLFDGNNFFGEVLGFVIVLHTFGSIAYEFFCVSRCFGVVVFELVEVVI